MVVGVVIRYMLVLVGRIAEVLCPAPASVRASVLAADVLAEREELVEVMEPIRLGPVAEPVSSGHPVEDLVEFHHVASITSDGIYCACHHRSRNFHGHAKHVAGFVLSMVEADARMSAASNKFQK